MAPILRFLALLALTRPALANDWYELTTCPCAKEDEAQHFVLPAIGADPAPIYLLNDPTTCFALRAEGCAWGSADTPTCVGLATGECGAAFNVSSGPDTKDGTPTVVVSYANNGAAPGAPLIPGYNGGAVCLDQARDGRQRVELYPCTPADRQQEWVYDGLDALSETWSGKGGCLCKGPLGATPTPSVSPTPSTTPSTAPSRFPVPSRTRSPSSTPRPAAAPPRVDVGLAVGLPLGLLVAGGAALAAAARAGLLPPTIAGALAALAAPPQSGAALAGGVGGAGGAGGAAARARAAALGATALRAPGAPGERVSLLAAKRGAGGAA